MKRFVLVDGHAILHRAYHAFPKTLKTRRGELVNAVYGFARILFRVVEDLKPDYLAVAVDLPEPTFRHQMYVGYQAHRPKAEQEFIDQIERAYQVLKVLEIPIVSAAGYEADDVIGTLAFQASKKKVKTVIVTGDKDIMQLVNKMVQLYVPVRGFTQAKLFGKKEVEEHLGVVPGQIVDYKGLVGDPSDNYPGVPGVGPKTAVKLLDKYNTLDKIYDKLDEIRPAVAKKLEAGRGSAELSQELARIVDNVPVKLNLRNCRLHNYDLKKVEKLFQELEFKSLLTRLPGRQEAEKKAKEKKASQMQLV